MSLIHYLIRYPDTLNEKKEEGEEEKVVSSDKRCESRSCSRRISRVKCRRKS